MQFRGGRTLMKTSKEAIAVIQEGRKIDWENVSDQDLK